MAGDSDVLLTPIAFYTAFAVSFWVHFKLWDLIYKAWSCSECYGQKYPFFTSYVGTMEKKLMRIAEGKPHAWGCGWVPGSCHCPSCVPSCFLVLGANQLINQISSGNHEVIIDRLRITTNPVATCSPKKPNLGQCREKHFFKWKQQSPAVWHCTIVLNPLKRCVLWSSSALAIQPTGVLKGECQYPLLQPLFLHAMIFYQQAQ